MALTLLPMAGAASPQHTDIKKPTRERVSKNNTEAKQKKDSKNANADPAVTKKEEAKPAAPAKKEEQAKQVPANTADTAKAAAPPKSTQRLNPDVTQFDGIDISKYQGTINWEELKKNSKIKFIFIKATEGSDYVDPRYHENIRNARKHGFKVGSYHFLSTSSSARAQFQNFIRTAKREDQDLLPVIDIERLKPWSAQQLRDSIKVFADLIEDYYGCKPLIYASERFFSSYLGRAFADYPLFIAKYSDKQPDIGYKWVLWQFSESGIFKAVKGNNGQTDMSRFGKGYSINDITYTPSKHKPRNTSVKDAVDHKEKPDKVNMTEQKPKDTPLPSKKQQEEAKKQAEKENKAKERSKKIADDEAKKKAEAQKKEQQKAEQLKREKAKQQAREEAAKKEAAAKAERKAKAQKARQQKAERDAKNKANKSIKTANLINSLSASKLSQSQRNDSIRNAQSKGLKTNMSSPDND